jgi:hypothetical protein
LSESNLPSRKEFVAERFEFVSTRVSRHAGIGADTVTWSFMRLTYLSGEPVMKGDRILYHGEPDEVEFIADGTDPETDCFVKELGTGIMIKTCSTYTGPGSYDWEDIEFVSRASLGRPGGD